MKVPKPSIKTNIIAKNKYNRLGIEHSKIKHILWYTEEKYTSKELWAFFNGVPYNKVGNKKFYLDESAHFIIDKQGNIIQCLPLEEACIYNNKLDRDSINIVTIGNEYTEEQYLSMVNLGAWLCQAFKLDPRKDNIIDKHTYNKRLWIKFKREQYSIIKEFKRK